MMHFQVFRAADNFKVVDPVVGFHPIFVVNNFRCLELPPKMGLHDKPVLYSPFAVAGNNPVALFINKAGALVQLFQRVAMPLKSPVMHAAITVGATFVRIKYSCAAVYRAFARAFNLFHGVDYIAPINTQLVARSAN